jgi:hypothetical protein
MQRKLLILWQILVIKLQVLEIGFVTISELIIALIKVLLV